MARDVLKIRNFAQIKNAEITFGDLTVLVGAQGTGKSLALQWLKCAMDGRLLIDELRTAGNPVEKSEARIDLVFGTGMGAAWRSNTSVSFGARDLTPEKLHVTGNGAESVFYVPAHRSMLISDGWAAPFQKLTSDTPVVARIFSQNLFNRFSARGAGDLFPIDRMLKTEYRDLINSAVFNGGKMGLEEDRQHAKRLRLSHGRIKLPFQTWTAGQREFAPLLLGLYHLFPRTNRRKQPGIDWVVIEEPEMGLHPKAISVVLLLVLELLWRGYRVALSTHSPHVLTAIWMLRRLQHYKAKRDLVCEAFDVPTSQQMRKVAAAALEKDYQVHLMAFGGRGKVTSKDISALDPNDKDERVAGWGGLTGFSSRFGDAVRKAVNESGR